MDQIPKPLLVAAIFIAGIAFIMMGNPQYTQCDAQIEIFRNNLTGDIFPSKGKKMTFAPKINTYLEACRQGNGPGGCFELLSSMKRMNREIRAFGPECKTKLGELTEVRRAVTESLVLLAQLAWGSQPPEGPEQRFSWLETGDLGAFCEFRQAYEQFYGKEAYDQFRMKVAGDLPGEAPVFEEGKCVNCEFRKKAKDVMPPDEIWKRSLFSVACSSYR